MVRKVCVDAGTGGCTAIVVVDDDTGILFV